MHALSFAAINIKANIVLCDAEDFFSIIYLMMLSVTWTIQHRGVQLFWQRTTTIIVGWFIGHTIYKCGCRLHNTTWWSTCCTLDTLYIVSIRWTRGFSEVERIWKQMWHNLIQYPSTCLKKFTKTRI